MKDLPKELLAKLEMALGGAIRACLLRDRDEIRGGMARMAIDIKRGKFPPDSLLKKLLADLDDEKRGLAFTLIGTFVHDFLDLLEHKSVPEVKVVGGLESLIESEGKGTFMDILKETDCGDPNCPIHGKGPMPEPKKGKDGKLVTH